MEIFFYSFHKHWIFVISQKTFQSFDMASRVDRGSHVSLNEPSIPKHRKTRFQQSSLQKCKIASKGNSDILPPKKHSYDSLDDPPTSVSNPGSVRKVRRSSFMPSKSLASATKLINQHLFGIQGANAKGKKSDFKIFHFCLCKKNWNIIMCM